jgi:trigger factor
MYAGRLEEMTDNFRRQVENQGMDFENYLRFAGMTETDLQAKWQNQAKLDVDSMLALEAVANAEGIEITDDEFKEKFAEASGLKDEEANKAIDKLHPRRKKDLVLSFKCDKAMEFVLEKAIATDEPFPDMEDFLPVEMADEDDIIDVSDDGEE